MFKENETVSSIIDEGELGELVVAVCATLYDNGIRHVNIGGLMRILGVEPAVAGSHDDEFFVLNDDFYEQVANMGYEEYFADDEEETPPRHTVH